MGLDIKGTAANGPGLFISLCHLGMVICGIAALLTGDMAGDYTKVEHFGFVIHGWAGIGLAVFVFMYICYRMFGPEDSRFSKWLPYNRDRMRLVMEDLSGIVKCRLPKRESHEGVAGLVQFFGVLAFSWLVLTGLLMFFMLEPGSKARGILHAVKEIHEAGVVLVALYLTLHIGAVLLHSFSGNHVWRKIFFIQDADR